MWLRQWDEAIVAPPHAHAPGGVGAFGTILNTEGFPRARHGGVNVTATPRGGERVVRLASHAPAEDRDLEPTVTAEMLTLLVEPRFVRRGHGSRLLTPPSTTCAKTLPRS
ncbi:hypothetical protein [Nonomuraea dietziae]|uniref:hypothetical protein n=1 Tax=Nonomuraea dietziae TaxID=65515 RepID=UPI0031D8976C